MACKPTGKALWRTLQLPLTGTSRAPATSTAMATATLYGATTAGRFTSGRWTVCRSRRKVLWRTLRFRATGTFSVNTISSDALRHVDRSVDHELVGRRHRGRLLGRPHLVPQLSCPRLHNLGNAHSACTRLLLARRGPTGSSGRSDVSLARLARLVTDVGRWDSPN